MNETFELTQRLISFDLDVLNRSKYIKPKIQELIIKHKSGKMFFRLNPEQMLNLNGPISSFKENCQSFK